MRPKEPDPSSSSDLFRNRLDNLLDQRHELYRLADLIDWNGFDTAFGELYCPDNGCPAKATRLMVGLQSLKHAYGLSDDEVVMRWVENPYWQYFCGEEYFQHQMPIDPSSLSRFRRRIGETGCTACMHRRWNVSAKARPTNAMSLVLRQVSRQPTRATSSWVGWPCPVTRLTVIPWWMH